METFPDIAPSYPSAVPNKFNVRRADYGDGYSQRSPVGINNLSKTCSVGFLKRPLEVCDRIEAFLVARQGAEAFWWQHPRDSVRRKWTCSEYTRTSEETCPSHDSITCTFVMEYDL